MKIYRTKAGDMWDALSFNFYGSCRYTEQLIDANRKHIETFIFKAGVELIIPDVETTTASKLPPWRR